jgi:hypothetical protein
VSELLRVWLKLGKRSMSGVLARAH